MYLKEINFNNIIQILNIKNKEEKNNKNKIIKINGNNNSGKSIFSIIISKLLLNKYKILLIDNDENNILSKILLENKNMNNEIIKILNNFYIINFDYILKEKINIINYLKKIKKEFDYIIMDSNNKDKNYRKIIDKEIYLIEPNMFEMKKIKKEIIQNNKIKIILNKSNLYSIDKNVIEKTINKKIIGEIEYSKNINLLINNNLELKYLNKKEINNIIKIIKEVINEN